MFENKTIRGIHMSRYIASFIRCGGILPLFGDWLEQLTIDGESLTEDEKDELYEFASCGKLELEMDARRFLAKR